MTTRAEKEEWLDVVGWEGYYQVSNMGLVRSIPREGETTFGLRSYGGSVLKNFKTSRGYLAVNLKKVGLRKQCSVHVLVLIAFVGPRPPGMQACHGNGDREDPKLNNLRWDSVSNNHLDKWLHGTDGAGEKNPNARLNDESVIEIRQSGLSLDQLAARFGVSRGCIEKAKYGTTWRHI